MQHDNAKVRGRRLIIEFTCGRCGAVEHLPYTNNPACNDRANMCNVPVPHRWKEADGYMPLLCPKCVSAYNAFMGIKEEVNEECQHKLE